MSDRQDRELNPTRPWIQLVDGKPFFFLDPKPEDIDIYTIAHCLARECRWGNQLRHHYSVADHSVRVSYECNPEDALWGLLHDASEAYLIDIPTPIKMFLRHGIDEFVGRLDELLCCTDVVSNDDRDFIVKGIREACPDMLGYDEMERRIQRAICQRFGLPEEMPASVVRADAVLLVTEKRDLAAPAPLPWGPEGIEPLHKRIIPHSETDAKAEFIRRFFHLTMES